MQLPVEDRYLRTRVELTQQLAVLLGTRYRTPMLDPSAGAHVDRVAEQTAREIDEEVKCLLVAALEPEPAPQTMTAGS